MGSQEERAQFKLIVGPPEMHELPLQASGTRVGGARREKYSAKGDRCSFFLQGISSLFRFLGKEVGLSKEKNNCHLGQAWSSPASICICMCEGRLQCV